jgi:hypothetical protein
MGGRQGAKVGIFADVLVDHRAGPFSEFIIVIFKLFNLNQAGDLYNNHQFTG